MLAFKFFQAKNFCPQFLFDSKYLFGQKFFMDQQFFLTKYTLLDPHFFQTKIIFGFKFFFKLKILFDSYFFGPKIISGNIFYKVTIWITLIQVCMSDFCLFATWNQDYSNNAITVCNLFVCN